MSASLGSLECTNTRTANWRSSRFLPVTHFSGHSLASRALFLVSKSSTSIVRLHSSCPPVRTTRSGVGHSRDGAVFLQPARLGRPSRVDGEGEAGITINCGKKGDGQDANWARADRRLSSPKSLGESGRTADVRRRVEVLSFNWPFREAFRRRSPIRAGCRRPFDCLLLPIPH